MPSAKKPHVDVCTATFSQMWLEGTPTRVIAETLKISADRCDVLRKKLKLKPRESWHGAKTGIRKAYIPSEEEIRQKCLEFQAGWSDEERERRLVGYDPERYAVDIRVISESSIRASYSSLKEESSPVENLADRNTSGG